MRDRSGNQGIIMSGNAKLDAENIAIGEHATINQVKREVISELRQMKDNIRALPDSVAREKAELEKYRSALEAEVSKPQPSQSAWDISAKGLVAAAKSIGAAAPDILKSAMSVAGLIGKLI
jgi:hypothetical protein